ACGEARQPRPGLRIAPPMLFRSRNRPTLTSRLRLALWPRRSFGRSARYFAKRLVRLRASPHAIAAGLAAGVFVAVTPFIGFQIILAVLLASFVRGNLIAAAIGTNLANPLTVPLIWMSTLELGGWILGNDHGPEAVERLVHGLSNDPIDQLVPVLTPMAVGAIPLGAAAALLAYGGARLAVEAYQA